MVSHLVIDQDHPMLGKSAMFGCEMYPWLTAACAAAAVLHPPSIT